MYTPNTNYPHLKTCHLLIPASSFQADRHRLCSMQGKVHNSDRKIENRWSLGSWSAWIGTRSYQFSVGFLGKRQSNELRVWHARCYYSMPEQIWLEKAAFTNCIRKMYRSCQRVASILQKANGSRIQCISFGTYSANWRIKILLQSEKPPWSLRLLISRKPWLEEQTAIKCSGTSKKVRSSFHYRHRP